MKRLIVLSIAVLGILVAGISSAQVTEEWMARYNGLGNSLEVAHVIAVDQAGNVYVTGESDVSGMGSNYDYATVKYDANGNELWV